MNKNFLSIVSDVVMFVFFVAMIIQMLFCALIGKKSWLEQNEENLFGE